MSQALRPVVSATPLLQPRAARALQAWLAEELVDPASGIPVVGIVEFLHVHAPQAATSLAPHPYASDNRLVVSTGVQPVIAGFGKGRGLVNRETLLGGALPGYAQLQLELDFSGIDGQLEADGADLFGTPRGVWYHVLHGRHVSVLSLGDPEVRSLLHREEGESLGSVPRAELLSVHVHDPAPSAHARLDRLRRLDELNRDIRCLWTIISSGPVDVAALEADSLA